MVPDSLRDLKVVPKAHLSEKAHKSTASKVLSAQRESEKEHQMVEDAAGPVRWLHTGPTFHPCLATLLCVFSCHC